MFISGATPDWTDDEFIDRQARSLPQKGEDAAKLLTLSQLREIATTINPVLNLSSDDTFLPLDYPN